MKAVTVPYPRRRGLQAMALLASLAMLIGCHRAQTVDKQERRIADLTASRGVLYVSTMSLRGMEDWHSEVVSVSPATGAVQSLLRTDTLLKSISVSPSGDIAATNVKPPLESEVWVYARQQSYQGRCLGPGLSPGWVADDILAFTTTRGGAPPATTTRLMAVGPGPTAAPTEIQAWGPSAAVRVAPGWVCVTQGETGTMYAVQAKTEGDVELRRRWQAATGAEALVLARTVAISRHGVVAVASMPQAGAAAVMTFGRSGRWGQSPEVSGVVEEIAWAEDGRSLAIINHPETQTWQVLWASPDVRTWKTLWESERRLAKLTALGPGRWAAVAGGDTVITIPDGKCLFRLSNAAQGEGQ